MRRTPRDKANILIAEDDLDDQLIIEEALLEAGLGAQHVKFVNNGNELLTYLQETCGEHSDTARPAPTLILLDINMPELNGLEALEAIKRDRSLSKIPIIILSTSCSDRDICTSYSLGVNSYITKPASFSSMVEAMTNLLNYWLDVVKLPDTCKKT